MKILLKAFGCMIGEIDGNPHAEHIYLPLAPRIAVTEQLLDVCRETGLQKARFDNMGDGSFELQKVE